MDRTPEEIAQSLNQTRERLISSLDEIANRTKPEKLAKAQLDRVREFYVDEHGAVRVDRAAKTAGVLAALVVLRKLFK